MSGREKSVIGARRGRPRATPAGAEKVSVSIDSSAIAWARRIAGATGGSLSSVVGEALKRMRQREARMRVLAELGAEDISEDEVQALYAEWRDAGLEV
jgi:hypothetical protein